MHTRHIKDMVLRYLRPVFEVTIILGMISFPPGRECFFGSLREMLQHSHLEAFYFDKPEDYVQVEDTTLSGVIAPAEKTPDCFLPMYPTVPFLHRNNRPYGPTILRVICSHSLEPTYIMDEESRKQAALPAVDRKEQIHHEDTVAL